MPPVHPGEILREEFLKPLQMNQDSLAAEISVPARIGEIIRGKRGINAVTALRLARYFNMTPQYWMELQTDYDLDESEEKINREIRSRSVCAA
ncbi:MAG: HigA family addiction module antitoxin [Desulfobacterales bacterium]